MCRQVDRDITDIASGTRGGSNHRDSDSVGLGFLQGTFACHPAMMLGGKLSSDLRGERGGGVFGVS